MNPNNPFIDDSVESDDSDWWEEPILAGAGPRGVLGILKTDPHVIRDAPMKILRAELEGMAPEDRAFVMSERKALRNRLSAQKCTKARQAHMHELQKKCDALTKEVAFLKSELVKYKPQITN